MGELDLGALIGEQFDFEPRTLVPASYYPVRLHVRDCGETDAKQVKNKETGEMEEGGVCPFVELGAEIYEGPFAGTTLVRRVYLTPWKSGGGLARMRGACKAITGQESPLTAAVAKFGIKLPAMGEIRPRSAKESMEQAQKRAVSEAIAAGFFALDGPARSMFAGLVVGLQAWDGKQVLLKVGLEDRLVNNRDGSPRWKEDALGAPVRDEHGQPVQETRQDNNFDGFRALTDPEKGMAWWRQYEKPKQEAAKKLMDGGA